MEEIIKCDISNTVYAEWNYKKDDKDIQIRLTTWIMKAGMLVLPVVRTNEADDMEVIDGNHRRRSLLMVLDAVGKKERGKVLKDYEEEWVRLYKEKGYNFHNMNMMFVGKIPLHQAKEIAVNLNGFRFEDDKEKLHETITDILGASSDRGVFSTMAYTEIDYDTMLLDEQARRKLSMAVSNAADLLDNQEHGQRSANLKLDFETYRKWVILRNKLANYGHTTDSALVEAILTLCEMDDMEMAIKLKK